MPKKRYKTSTEAHDLSLDLLEAAEQYSALEVPDDAIWSRHSSKTREHVASLKTLGSKQVKPIMLSALKKFDAYEMERLLRLLEVVIVRYQLIGEGRTGVLEIACAKLAQEIWAESVNSASAAAMSLGAVLPSDEEFRSAFQRKGDLSNQKAQYILRRIEDHERQTSNPKTARELSPTSDNLTIEHILPRNGGPAWQTVIDADPEIISDCSQRIGNFCILLEGSNRGLGRSSFEEKARVYGVSDLLTTRYIAGYRGIWDRSAIQTRQNWLASRAVTVWRFQ